jgi:DNA (cytosine-5)-methyltransferase 1
MTEIQILESLLKKAVKNSSKKRQPPYSEFIVSNIDVVIAAIDKNKSLVSALVTSLLKKITDPKQDIRLHRTDFESGYSARSLDTEVTTPFFKHHFPKYANKESGFLSMATRAQIPWTKEDGGRIRTRASKEFMTCFLDILDSIERNAVRADEVLTYFFERLYQLTLHQQQIFMDVMKVSDLIDVININTVIQMLTRHFSLRLSSRLPVIAVYSVYQQLIFQVNRYKNKLLSPLNVHTSADKHGYGDIEILNNNGTPFEMIEIKHNIPIDRNLLFDVVKKSQSTSIQRYYILTTASNNYVSAEEETFINIFILKIKKDSGLEIITNGIFPSLKYYLRLIDDYKEFLQAYTRNLVADSQNSTEVKEFHITEWNKILKEHQINVHESFKGFIISKFYSFVWR